MATPKPDPHAAPSTLSRRFGWREAVTLMLAALFVLCLRMASQEAPQIVWTEKTTAESPAGARVAEPVPRPAIVIDAGHGGADPGTVGNGQYEKTWVLVLSNALAEELRQRGWEVLLTRRDDATIPLIDRSVRANAEPRLAFISLHLNAGGPEASGIETYYAWPKAPEVMARLELPGGVPPDRAIQDDRGRLLAEAIQHSVTAATSARDRGVKNQPQYSVISRTRCPAVLVECGFLTSPAEAAAIQTADYRNKLVRGLANGLEIWLRQAEAPEFGWTHVAEGCEPPLQDAEATGNP